MPPGSSDRTKRWPPAMPADDWMMPGWRTTIGRGIAGNCPHCGLAPIFDGYLTVFERCSSCAAQLGAMPADDTPPYIAMLFVLQFVGLFITVSYRLQLHPNLAEIGFLLLLLVLFCLTVLRMAKGAVIGILLKLDTNREKPNA
jgi:uncharacterized protein (DUF983 family)